MSGRINEMGRVRDNKRIVEEERKKRR